MGSCFSSRVKADSPLHNGSRVEADSPLHNGSRVEAVSPLQNEGDIFLSPTLRSFSFNELKTATGNFDIMVGKGRFTSVFKGWVNGNSLTAANPGTGMLVAVKRLHEKSHRAHMKWLREINYVRRLHHPNLVKLIGYCSEDDERLLVYEFMPCGSLDNHLFTGGSYLQPLSWTVRMKIALGTAKVLAFFHSDEAKVIYRNFHISNILLDSNYNAKLGSLGLATRTDISSIPRKFKGTYAYAPLEYILEGHLSAKCDVYGFGVVMLEMMTGKRAWDRSRPRGEQHLVEWAKPYLVSKLKVLQIIDVCVKGTYSAASACKAAELALQCLPTDPEGRPNINDVVKTLEQLQESSDMDGPIPSQNEPRQNSHAISSNGPKHWGRSVDGNNNSTTDTHSRPSARSNT
ncbi:hypothetical protein M0R45_035657 [Rubus argutus]|uniref:Protein kinase domain-containing protein n=1 Tax=Rubus argutus TaxID=59490 RepID=A0AAW1VY77_RUBAR